MTRALVFLGTGAAGGTEGMGRSRRRESSALLTDPDVTLLIDVTRHFSEQAHLIPAPPDAVLLTHGHADAIGGIAALGRWVDDDANAIPVLGSAATLAAVQRRFRRLHHCHLQSFEPGERRRIGGWTLTSREIPHAADPDRFPTSAWRLTKHGTSVVYASDVARPTDSLRELSRGAALLVADGAAYGRRIPTHLRIDQDLRVMCRWPVGRILLTQIGATAPPHTQLAQIVRGICPRAEPAYDRLELALGEGSGSG